MMWIPLRSVKMNGFMRGFHLRVRCPKWTPVSRSAFILMTAIVLNPPVRFTSAFLIPAWNRAWTRHAQASPKACVISPLSGTPLIGHDSPARPRISGGSTNSITCRFGPVKGLDEFGCIRSLVVPNAEYRRFWVCGALAPRPALRTPASRVGQASLSPLGFDALHETVDVDHCPPVFGLPDQLMRVPHQGFEDDRRGLDRYHLCPHPDGSTDRCRGEMADLDGHTDRRLPRRKPRLDHLLARS